MRKDKASLLMLGMRQRIKTFRKQILVPDLVRGHRRQTLPGHTDRKFYAHALLHRLHPVHCHTRSGVVAEIVALVEERVVLLFDGGLGGRQARSDRGERLGDVDRHIARLAALGLLSLLRVGLAESHTQADNREEGPTAFARGSPHHILPDWRLADILRIPEL